MYSHFICLSVNQLYVSICRILWKLILGRCTQSGRVPGGQSHPCHLFYSLYINVRASGQQLVFLYLYIVHIDTKVQSIFGVQRLQFGIITFDAGGLFRKLLALTILACTTLCVYHIKIKKTLSALCALSNSPYPLY